MFYASTSSTRLIQHTSWPAPTWGGPRTPARSSCSHTSLDPRAGWRGNLRGLTAKLITVRTARGGGDAFILNPNTKKFIPRRARREHHRRERYVCSLGSGEAGHCVGMQARQEQRERWRWLGRLHPVNGNQGAYRATKQRAAFALLILEKKRTQERQKRGGDRQHVAGSPRDLWHRDSKLRVLVRGVLLGRGGAVRVLLVLSLIHI